MADGKPRGKSEPNESGAAKPKADAAPRKTEDGRYVVIEGRRWRATNPALPEEERRRLVSELMDARREVGKSLRKGDKDAEAAARRRVHAAKVALGERGPKWWEEGKDEG